MRGSVRVEVVVFRFSGYRDVDLSAITTVYEDKERGIRRITPSMLTKVLV
jgi:hypothetical protein